MKQRTSLFIAVIILETVLNTSLAHASLDLTFDASELTYTWTGSATSPLLTVPTNSSVNLAVGHYQDINGWAAIVMPYDPGAITVTQFNDFFTESDNFEAGYGSPSIIATQVGVNASVASFSNYESSGSTDPEFDYVTVTGNGVEVSYASANLTVRARIQNLDGKPLYFKTHTAQSIGNVRELFPDQVGTIHVIPEPSTLGFFSVASGVIALYRKLAHR